MRPNDLDTVMQRLAVDINAQKIRLNAQAGPAF